MSDIDSHVHSSGVHDQRHKDKRIAAHTCPRAPCPGSSQSESVRRHSRLALSSCSYSLPSFAAQYIKSPPDYSTTPTPHIGVRPFFIPKRQGSKRLQDGVCKLLVHRPKLQRALAGNATFEGADVAQTPSVRIDLPVVLVRRIIADGDNLTAPV